jgi:hypothetical protein
MWGEGDEENWDKVVPSGDYGISGNMEKISKRSDARRRSSNPTSLCTRSADGGR